MFPSSADYARRHMGRVAMLVLGAATCLTLAAAVDVPSVKAIDPGVTGVFGGLRNERPPARRDLVAGERLADILEHAGDGETVIWRNPDTQVTYRIHPLASFRTGDRTCRTFTIRRTADSSVRESYRTACQQADGAWSITTVPDGDPNG